MRIPAQEIEHAVRAESAHLLSDPLELMTRAQLDVRPDQFEGLMQRMDKLHHKVAASGKRQIRKLIKRITVHPDRLELTMDIKALAVMLDVTVKSEAPATFVHKASIRLTRTGHTLKLIDASGCAVTSKPDKTLTRLLAQAHQWWGELAKGELDIATLSRREDVSASWMTRVIRLAFLAPPITEAILEGKAHAEMDATGILKPDVISPEWNAQRLSMLP